MKRGEVMRIIRMSARVAGKSLSLTGTAIGYIVHVHATQRQGERKMGKRDYDNLLNYTLAMGIAKSMLSQGVLTEDEYEQIERKMCEKYCIDLSSIFRISFPKSLDI